MYDDRLAGFSRDRLDGRPISDDLRVLLVAQREDRTDLTRLLDLDFFGAGEVHPLLDTSYLSEEERADVLGRAGRVRTWPACCIPST
ncbi:hypothetical protein OG206_02370 [Streptomyces sp. NBC_01341]|uniref:hypothetical protein n=1 Tax=Streptomyces sp. NBC_01341 TaxID=2903831 RepID=UPI002E126E85|nr:hypothetical protein OG206_02370 [Streptomyces sp. NBC_01341]